MKDNIVLEVGVAVILAVLVAVLTYAHQAWMPTMATMAVLLAVVASFAGYALFVWRERDGDERENFIRNFGSRIAFLATGAVLVAAIIVQTALHSAPDPWIGGALIVMVSAKIIGHAYGRRKY